MFFLMCCYSVLDIVTAKLCPLSQLLVGDDEGCCCLVLATQAVFGEFYEYGGVSLHFIVLSLTKLITCFKTERLDVYWGIAHLRCVELASKVRVKSW